MQTMTPGLNPFAAYACSYRICQLESLFTLKQMHFNGQLRYAYVAYKSLKNSSVKWTFSRVESERVSKETKYKHLISFM